MTKYLILFFCFATTAQSQPNCNVFLAQKDTAQYEACQYVTEHKADYYQFDWRQMEIWEKAIEMCPRLAYPIREYGVPYLKAGNFIEWKKHMDRAVELAPLDYLGVRGSLKCKFIADYQGAIQDIDELSSLLKGYDIGATHDGTYHLIIVKGLCYKALGKKEKAIQIIEKQILKEDHYLGLYDYLHLGVLYLENSNYEKAIENLKKQSEQNDIAENHYYLAKAYRGINKKEKYEEQINVALDFIKKERTMTDPYNELFDKVYLQDIQDELNKEWQ